MIVYLLWLAGRAAVAAFALLTWAYCVSTYSAFAYDNFVGPRLFVWLEDFVNWHYAWFAGAYLVAALTLIPDLAGRTTRVSRVLAIAFLIVFAGVDVWLIGNPYLRLLSVEARGAFTGYVALAPLLWLAIIDIAATRRPVAEAIATLPHTSQRRLLWATLGATAIVWTLHFARAAADGSLIESRGAWVVAAAWSFGLDLMGYSMLFLLLVAVVCWSATRRNARGWEFAAAATALAIGVMEFCRRVIFPSLGFSALHGALIAVAFAITVVAMWSGWRMRRGVITGDPAIDASVLIAPAFRSQWLSMVAIIPVILTALAIVDRIQYVDWDFIVQKMTTLIEALMVFGLLLRSMRDERHRGFSIASVIAVPLFAVILLFAVPYAARATGDDRINPEVVRDQYAVLDPTFRLTSDAFTAQRQRDADYVATLLGSSQRSLLPVPLPTVNFGSAPPASPPELPHIFIFVIDGLRRDYLSPYNATVDFTPAFQAWAESALVFQNAYTKYGGTWMAMPSLWSGAPIRRSWSRAGFDRMNSLEQLVTSRGYRIAINDYTVEGHLRQDTKRTFLDPQIKSVDTDICRNFETLQPFLEQSPSPLFTFLSPMNVYVLNSDPGQRFQGFNPAYAANVQRVDRCFGAFIEQIKRNGMYDNSVIVVTADHGESLGEDGNVGHQFFLFPEVVRIPLIMSVPDRLRGAMTTDLGRVAFSSDIVPTIYRLLGYDVPDLGKQFGSPLLTHDDALPDRRRESYLLMSSYGAAYGMLRRNGRHLYISDLIGYREYAYSLYREPLGLRQRVSDDLRRVNQALIRKQADEIDAIYPRP